MSTKKLERIFSHAVALHQAGRLRSAIYAHKKRVYVLNMDKTVLLRFIQDENPFNDPIGFTANDYDSHSFEAKDGQVVFTQRIEGFERRKSCRPPEHTFKEVHNLFQKYQTDQDSTVIIIQKPLLDLLEENLSHLEVSTRDGSLVVTQRDIYTGTVIEVERVAEGGFGLTITRDSVEDEVQPFGLRTNDLMALFSFCDEVQLRFPENGAGYCLLEGDKYKMRGVISHCLYDELGTATLSRKEHPHGRQKSKKRRSQQKADHPSNEKQMRRGT